MKIFFLICFVIVMTCFWGFCGVVFAAQNQTLIEITSLDDRSGVDLNLLKNLLRITGAGKLIVKSLYVDNNSDVVIKSGGVLIIEGDLITDNKMTIEAGGTLIVLGNFVHTGSDTNQGGFTSSNPSNVYILGTIDGAVDGSGLNPDLYPVLQCDSTDPLDDYVNSGCNFGKELDLIDDPIYQSICGVGLTGGVVSNQSGDCFESVVLINETEASILNYRWYLTTDAGLLPPVKISSWTLIPEANTKDCVYEGIISETTYFVRQAQMGLGCVVYSNVVEVQVSGDLPVPIGIYHE